MVSCGLFWTWTGHGSMWPAVFVEDMRLFASLLELDFVILVRRVVCSSSDEFE